MSFFGHAGQFDLLFQIVVFALLTAAQFFLNGLDLLIEVILFLRPFHLALDAALDGAVDTQFFNLNVQHFRYAREAVNWIEDF